MHGLGRSAVVAKGGQEERGGIGGDPSNICPKGADEVIAIEGEGVISRVIGKVSLTSILHNAVRDCRRTIIAKIKDSCS